ncbi:MAG: DUF2232 domain-containing protein [Rhodospirillales bacterium]
MSKTTLIVICGGVISALASMLILTGSPGVMLFVYLSPLPLLLVGLSLGTTAAALAGANGFIVATMLGGVMAASIYAIAHAIPAWLVVRQALRQTTAAGGGVTWYPAGSILCWLVLLGASVFLFAAIINTGGADGLEVLVGEYLNGIFASMAPALPEADRRMMAQMIAPLFPGVAAISWVLMTVLNAVFAQSILVKGGRNLRPTPSFKDLDMPDWISWLLVGSALAALLGGGEIEYIARNLAMIMATPFFFLGLAVVHGLAGLVTFPGVLLSAFYLVLFFSSWALLAVAGLGVVEQWIGLRRRFAGFGPKVGE